jgi:hypothetical protein
VPNHPSRFITSDDSGLIKIASHSHFLEPSFLFHFSSCLFVRALVSATFRVISNMPRNVVLHALSIHLLFTTSICAFNIALSLTSTSPEEAITAPARMHNLEGAKVTAAPELKRQDAINYCTEWSIVNGNSFISADCYERN